MNITNEFDKDLAERELKELLIQLDNRKRNFGILDVDVINGKNGKPPIVKQAELFQNFRDRLSIPISDRIRYMLYYGGNGAGKTFIGAYVVALLAIGHDCEKY